MPRSNCDRAPTAIDPISGTGKKTFHNVDTAHHCLGGFRCRHRVLWPSQMGLGRGTCFGLGTILVVLVIAYIVRVLR
jgi:hypothetical protein